MGKNPKSKPSVKKVFYASKIVGESISRLSTIEIERAKKNPDTLQKWLEKMKLSIQRKVSECSKRLFVSSLNDPQQLSVEIKNMSKQVLERSTAIKNKALSLLSKTKLALKLPVDKKKTTKQPSQLNQFESRVSKVTDTFEQIGTQIVSVGTELQTKIQSLAKSVNTSQGQWRTSSSKRKILQSNESDTHSSSSSFEVSSDRGGHTFDTGNPIYSLNQHLEKR